MNWQGCDTVGGRTKLNSVSCLPLAILTLTEKETLWQAQQKIFPTSFFQVLGWASSSGKIPPKGPAHWPNKKCHFVCPAPYFLRANRATNTSCCHVTSNCRPSHPRNANHASPSADLSFPWYTGEQIIWTSAFLSAATSATVSCRGNKARRYLVYSPPYSPPFILQLGCIWSLSEALWSLTEPSKLLRE